jgi:hypothetical protein
MVSRVRTALEQRTRSSAPIVAGKCRPTRCFTATAVQLPFAILDIFLPTRLGMPQQVQLMHLRSPNEVTTLQLRGIRSAKSSSTIAHPYQP